MDIARHGFKPQKRSRQRIWGIVGLVWIGAVAVGVQVIYGVIAQSVVQRTQEIAIRMAMSATRENILHRRAFLGLSGTAVGIFGALVFARRIESLLYEIPPRNPMTYVSVSAILGFVALLASYIPAARATLLDPIGALRYE